MKPFVFRVDRPEGEPLVRNRNLPSDAEAVAYARQLLNDWPECIAVEVLQAGALVDRLRPTQS
ncbi:hypothetical protein [Caulobacter sp. S45]|jgi:hypothetical protein|uniref:hypothetical protein n=1 Tax=Caulobacter sp. S45 TaxID=1641861 RepID=UPI00131EBCA1|nr:hypothetical protein [Caulobacter sp. S45]